MKRYSIAILLAVQALLFCCTFTSCGGGGDNLQYAVSTFDASAADSIKLIGTAESKKVKGFIKDLYPGLTFPKGVDVTAYQVQVGKGSSAWYFVYTKDGKPVYAQKFPSKGFRMSMAFGKEAWAETLSKLGEGQQ